MGRVGGSTDGVEKLRNQEGALPALDGTSMAELALQAGPFTGYPDPKPSDRDHDHDNAALAGVVAARLRRDTVVILRLDGEDLEDLAGGGPELQELVDAAYPLQGPDASLRDRVRAAIGMLTVDHGMPPSSDPLVVEDVVEPAMGFVSAEMLDQPVSLEGFAIVFRKIVEGLAQRLKERPVIVACCEDTFDGSDINWLLSEKRDLDKFILAPLC